jgi:hypothetical protein
MPNRTLDDLGEALITRVRDRTIRHWDKIVDGSMKGETAEQARRELSEASDPRVAVEGLIPRIVDSTLYQLLQLVADDERLSLSVQSHGGSLTDVREVSDGLGGELFGRNGWIARFSKERNEEA